MKYSSSKLFSALPVSRMVYQYVSCFLLAAHIFNQSLGYIWLVGKSFGEKVLVLLDGFVCLINFVKMRNILKMFI